MSSHTLGFFDIEAPKATANPPPNRNKSAPTDYELDAVSFRNPLDGPSTSASGNQTSKTPNDVESLEPPSPRGENTATELVQTMWNPPMNKWRVLCACLVYFGNGINDAVPGALIPYMETHYSIGYAVVALIFVANAVGFITAAFCTDAICGPLGRAKTLMLSEASMAIGYVMLVCTPPFPVVVVSFLFLGYGCAINLALNNVFCANLAGSTVILGFAHGSYGIGGTIGPIVATAMASHGVIWSRFYFITLGIRIACIAFNGWAFWNYEKETPAQLNAAQDHSASQQAAGSEPTASSKRALLKEALRNKVTIIGAIFIFVYQGAEVSISGWFISFLISYRGGDPATVGYVTAGFFGGVTIGRFTLTHLAHRIGERASVYILTVGIIAFQLLSWLIPNVIGDAVAVSVLGLFLGPVYPCAQTIFSRLLPHRLHTSAVGFIASAGSSGGAVAPFTTGLLAQAVGTWVLHPVCLGLFVAMGFCWWCLPTVRKRVE